MGSISTYVIRLNCLCTCSLNFLSIVRLALQVTVTMLSEEYQMTKHYDPGDRVIVKYKDQRGEVVSPKDNFLQREYIVKLDETGTEESILERDLELENLSQSEIDSEVKKLKNLIKETSDKISDKVAKELPQHLDHLQNALKTKDKQESENEYTYIAKEMKRVLDSKLLAENTSLKKLQHYWKKFPQ